MREERDEGERGEMGRGERGGRAGDELWGGERGKSGGEGEDLEGAAQDLKARDVVDGEGGTALVFVGEEGEPHRLARLLVAHQVYIHDLAKGGEDSEGLKGGAKRGMKAQRAACREGMRVEIEGG